MNGAPAPRGAGAYVHIPFCARRCDYCAFATWTDRDHLIDRYVDAVVAHARRTFDPGGTSGPSRPDPGAIPALAVRPEGIEPVTSVFVGGGTPTRIPAGALVRILDAIPRAEGAEVTVECNPDDVTDDLVDTYLLGGVTRLSMGVQSLDPAVLASLGRTHDPAAVRRAAEVIRRAGPASWSVDLIYGAAGESRDSWQRTVEGLLALGPPHVSAYALTVEGGTPLADDPGRHPDDDDLAGKYELADELLAAAGRPWYEISNWAEPGHECRHNLTYWHQGDYHAFGCAAHGHRHGRRWWNHRSPERYLRAVEDGREPLGGSEDLEPAVRAEEALQLGVRLRSGVAARHLPADRLAALPPGLVEAVGPDRFVLTRAGRLLANEVSLALVP